MILLAPNMTSGHYKSLHTDVPKTFNSPYNFFVFGGEGSKTWQAFNGVAWSTEAVMPLVASTLSSGCATYRDDFTIILAGGSKGNKPITLFQFLLKIKYHCELQDGVFNSNNVFFLTFPGASWSQGPSLAQV